MPIDNKNIEPVDRTLSKDKYINIDLRFIIIDKT